MRRWFAVLALATVLAGCSSDEADEGGGRSTTTTAAASSTTTAAVRGVKLTELARLDQPLAMAVRSGDRTLYVAEKGGRVRRLVDGRATDAPPLLDISDRVSTGGEQGLLGLAWAPDGRVFYVNYTDRDGDTHVVEYPAPADGEAQVAADRGRELLVQEQPFANHNGGNLVFGPDGLLWIGLGDGGSGGDPRNNAQNLRTLLGKMLRIDPRPSGGRPYTVPPDNPFVGRAAARPEIWSYGLRNPWRYSFDRETGDLWIGDVGQNAWEEIDVAPAGSPGGENWGWPAQEGTHAYRGRAPVPGSVDPVYEYSLDGEACAVTGGYVYRGRKLASLLAGKYLFTDACVGELQVLTRPADVQPLGLSAGYAVSFGEDHEGELYVLSLEGPVYRLDPS